jgi:FlaA1/EpsC-like NDP-sugar epimerase
VSVAGNEVASDHRLQLAVRSPAVWTRTYLRWAALADCACALVAGAIAVELRFANQGSPNSYLAFTAALPACWWAAVALSGGYESRFIGAGSEEFRRILNAALSLTAGVAVLSYALKLDFARGYFMIALPCTAAFDLTARYRLRKHLHKLRRLGMRMQRVVAVGHGPAVADLVAMLRRDSHHGL